MEQTTDCPGLSRFAALTAVCTLALICVGGIVTSKGVGMAVPDWPTTYGYNPFFFPIPKWAGGIRDEHLHRLVASGVGLLTTILALWLHGRPARRLIRWVGSGLLLAGLVTGLSFPARVHDVFSLGIVGGAALGASFYWPRCEPSARWLRRLGLIAFIAVVIQGVLGGLRVTEMKDELGVFHAILAQIFFCLICAIALFTSRWWRSGDFLGSGRLDRDKTAWLVPVATILILAQLILGATMRHQHAGLAIPDFPAAYGKVWPDLDGHSIALYNQARLEVNAVNPITAFQIVLQMVHRILALGIAFAVGLCAWRARRLYNRSRPLRRLSRAWLGMILIQILLGAATIWTGKSADMATAHVAVGALSLGTGVLATILAARCRTQRRVDAPAGRRQADSVAVVGSPSAARGL